MMRNHVRLWLVPLLFVATCTAAAAADSVTISNASAFYRARVHVLKGGVELGAGELAPNARKTIALKDNPAGGTMKLELTLNGKVLCSFTSDLKASNTAWTVTGEPATAGNYATAKCTLKRA